MQEHTDLIASIRKGKPINELKTVAESTLTAIMGRKSAYTGKVVTLDEIVNAHDDPGAGDPRLSAQLPTPPVPMPGATTN